MGGWGSGRKKVLTNAQRKKRKKESNLKHRDREKNRINVNRWRADNREKAREINRKAKLKKKIKILQRYFSDLKYRRKKGLLKKSGKS